MLAITTAAEYSERSELISKNKNGLGIPSIRAVSNEVLLEMMKGWYGWGRMMRLGDVTRFREVGTEGKITVRVYWWGATIGKMQRAEFRKLRHYHAFIYHDEVSVSFNLPRAIKLYAEGDTSTWFIARTESAGLCSMGVKTYFTGDNGVWPTLFPICMLVASRMLWKSDLTEEPLEFLKKVVTLGNPRLAAAVDYDFMMTCVNMLVKSVGGNDD